ncbi:MAG TPA: hypothetical protein PLE30_11330 [Candidatus Kapabacteria bacterium]|nr:hypothetical protein [Candidatus Kapabacteria bacterium]
MNQFEELKRRIETAKKTRFNDFILGLFVSEIIIERTVTKEQAIKLYKLLGYDPEDHIDDLLAFHSDEPEED